MKSIFSGSAALAPRLHLNARDEQTIDALTEIAGEIKDIYGEAIVLKPVQRIVNERGDVVAQFGSMESTIDDVRRFIIGKLVRGDENDAAYPMTLYLNDKLSSLQSWRMRSGVSGKESWRTFYANDPHVRRKPQTTLAAKLLSVGRIFGRGLAIA